MAITYPLSLAAFADTLGIEQLQPRSGRQQQSSSLGSGEALNVDLAPARQEYDVTLRPYPHSEARVILAKLRMLEADTQATFYIGDPRYVGPASDPDGSALSGSTVQINSLNANTKALSLKGLPADFVLSVGDVLSFDYGSSPTRRAWHTVVEAVTANGSGVTAEFEVRDFIKTGAAEDDTVTLVNPSFKAQLVRGSISESAQGTMTTISFAVRQVL